MNAAGAVLGGVLLASLAASDGTDWLDSYADESSIFVSGARDEGALDPTSSGGATYEYMRRRPVICGSVEARAFSPDMCIAEIGDTEVTRVCADGSTALDPLFRRAVDPATGDFTGLWEQVDNGGCPEDPPVSVVLTAAQFRRLPLAASTPSIQPADGRTLVSMGLIVWTDPTPQTLTTTILGVPVTVTATPSTYTWDFGDDTDPLTTTDPGHPWPEPTHTRPYPRPGQYTLTLTTTWTGRYQVGATGPWHTVTGTATTTSTPLTVTAEEARNHLVAEP